MGEVANPALALRDLRRARHRRHREDVDWIETLYRVYVTVLLAAAFVWLSASRLTDEAARPGGLADIRGYGAAVLGLGVAFVVALGLRSGSRGGPLSLEAAEVRVVLLAPVRRKVALRAPALRQVRSAAFGGLCAGAVAGNVAGQRLPGAFAGWVVAGAAFGLLAALLAVGAALLACGVRLPRAGGTALGAALLGWSGIDVATGAVTSPFTLCGRIGLGPLPGDVTGGPVGPAVVVGVGLTTAVLALAAARLGHMSLEAAERRGRLAAQLRFALSLQDLRAVVLLRRRLAAEVPRARPWFRLPEPRRRKARRRRSAARTGVPDGRQAPARNAGSAGRGADPLARDAGSAEPFGRGPRSVDPAAEPFGRSGQRGRAAVEARPGEAGSARRPGLVARWRGDVPLAVRRRGLQSLLRWPVTRILRVVGLGVVAGFAAGGAWKGTTPLIVVAGVALFVAALDMLEPMAQEIDHPSRRDSYPLLPGRILVAAVAVPAVMLGAVTAVGVGVAVAVLGLPVSPMVWTVIPATAGAVAGGAASLILEPVSAAELMSRYQVPEAAGPIFAARVGFPPALAVSGWAAMFAGRAALDQDLSPGSAAFQAAIAVVGLNVLVVQALIRRFEHKRAVPEP